MMKTKKFFLFLFNLLLLLKCSYGLVPNGLCTLDTNGTVPNNLCDHSNYLVYVIESESGCSTAGRKCWCILIDNRNRDYDGDMVIEMVQIFSRDNLNPDKIQFGDIKSYLTFKIISGINRILVQPYTPPDALTKITSIKIRNNEICIFSNNTPQINLDFQQRINNIVPSISNGDAANQEYRYFSDCMHRPEYTANSIWYCPNYRPEFMIEKRSTNNHAYYWCINIDNSNYTLTSANHLHIVYTSQSRRFVYSPLDAYIEREIPGCDFHLGSRRTIIAISENHNELADISSITIDNQPICDYFEPRLASRSSHDLPAIQSGPENQPTELFIPPNQSIKNSNSDLVDYPTAGSKVNQQNSLNPSNTAVRTCGIKPIHKNSLISFGSNTNPGDWPWHAAIYKLQTKAHRNFICGGTLINSKAIVTAAHCILEFNLIVIPERLTVELGRYDLTITSVATQEYRVFDVIPHDAYNPDTFENDIAILTLANYVQLTKYVHFVCLPSPNVNLQNQMGTIVGWGRDHKNQLQTELKEANLPVVDKIKCLASNRDFFGQYLTNTNYCAGFKNNTNVCRGDSGGGLVFKTKKHWYLGGITSIGVSLKSVEHECDLTQYVIFTDVTKFVSWIKQYS